MRPSEAKEIMVKCVQAHYPVLLSGAPGVCKTALAAEAAIDAGAKLIVTHPVVSDPTDYKGLPGIVNGKAEFLPFGELRKLCEATELTVCLIDDFGQAPPAVQAACMQLLHGGRVNGTRVSQEVTWLSATNRRQDKAGVSGMLEPVKSRFVTILEVEPNLEDWCEWAIANGIEPEVIAFLRFRPELLHDFRPTLDITQSACPRNWEHVSRMLAIGIDHPEALTGAVGEGPATEFSAFRRIYQKLPNPDAVLMNPDTADVPDDPATLYALCGALAARANPQNAERLVKYAARLPDEFSVLLVRDAARRDEYVLSNPEGVKWSTQHQGVL